MSRLGSKKEFALKIPDFHAIFSMLYKYSLRPFFLEIPKIKYNSLIESLRFFDDRVANLSNPVLSEHLGGKWKLFKI